MKPVARLTLVAALFLALPIACKKEKNEPQPNSPIPPMRVEVGHEHTPAERHVYLYAERNPLYEGYNRLWLQIKNANGSLYAGSDVRIVPLMFMMNHTHSCPVEQVSGGPDEQGYYTAAAFFQMPSNDQEPWKVRVYIGGTDSVDIPITVNPHPQGFVRRKMFGGMPFLYELRPAQLAVGSQDVTLYVYRREMSRPMTDPAGFPPANDRVAKVALKTWMPSMGHGAEGTQDATPLPDMPGHYRGKLGFNMTGDWEIYTAFIGTGGDTLGIDTFAVRF
ncbi:MAG: hypothetical protein KatS3mg026_0440 [Bacteroidia bacterium]|nr:MAG: hypothetical protein KatS3mg026_0440 [Bacteroidia bacterium]